MARTRAAQITNASQIISGRSISQTKVPSSGRSIVASSPSQPSFIQELLDKLGADRVPVGRVEVNRSGDVRAQDLVPRSISDIQIKDDAGDIHVTIGKYDGTNFGLAAGSDTDAPDLTLDKDNLTINTTGFLKFASGARFIMWNPANDKAFQLGYILTQFQIISTTDTNGVLIGRNVCLGDQSPNYGGGARVTFIGNAQIAPSSNPTNGGVLYAEGGALKFRGSSGTVTTIAPS